VTWEREVDIKASIDNYARLNAMKRGLPPNRPAKKKTRAEERLISNGRHLIRSFKNSELTVGSMINRAMSLLHEFTSDAALKSYRSLVESADETLITSAKCAVEGMRKASLMIYNPFLTSGFKPDEDEFSDALAELFNPRLGHGFQKSMIETLLDIVATKTSDSELNTKVTGRYDDA
jgi:hypothetical protein